MVLLRRSVLFLFMLLLSGCGADGYRLTHGLKNEAVIFGRFKVEYSDRQNVTHLCALRPKYEMKKDIYDYIPLTMNMDTGLMVARVPVGMVDMHKMECKLPWHQVKTIALSDTKLVLTEANTAYYVGDVRVELHPNEGKNGGDQIVEYGRNLPAARALYRETMGEEYELPVKEVEWVK